MKKASADACFKEGCRETAAGRDGCVGACKQLLREETADGSAAQEAVSGQGGIAPEAPRPAEEAPVEETASAQAARLAAMSQFVNSRLCRACKHFTKPLSVPLTYGLCQRPGLPINLITGARSFPAITARQHAELCGYMGVHWEVKK